MNIIYPTKITKLQCKRWIYVSWSWNRRNRGLFTLVVAYNRCKKSSITLVVAYNRRKKSYFFKKSNGLINL